MSLLFRLLGGDSQKCGKGLLVEVQPFGNFTSCAHFAHNLENYLKFSLMGILQFVRILRTILKIIFMSWLLSPCSKTSRKLLLGFLPVFLMEM